MMTAAPVQARLIIEITGGYEAAIPIAVVPFAPAGAEGQVMQQIDRILRDDLDRSGRFRVLPEGDLVSRANQPEDVQFRTWQALGQEFLLIGRIDSKGLGQYQVEFNLFDTFRKEQLVAYRIPSTVKGLRRTAHRIADLVYQEITGQAGAFSSRIAYVTDSVSEKKGREYRLQVADADGYNPQTILTSREPIMSPCWSPDGKRIAYVSFEKNAPSIFVQTLATGAREKVSAYVGLNGAPAWSPDGTRLALTLSKDGSPDIYILDLVSRSLQRLTRSFSIDTEPVWSVDGSRIIFTSDRGGRPQLYSISIREKQVQRLTYEGDYNAGAAVSPDGKFLAMVHGSNGAYRIAVQELATGSLSVLTDGVADESPSFALNGSMILYATRFGGREQLAAVSVDGRVRQRLLTSSGGVREPVWSLKNLD
ncbi:MAG: Tol-Pal system protein TolB [Methylococcus sp.]|nr:MAG: Tol-Pal system protein TolB [Methylococcus sp.]